MRNRKIVLLLLIMFSAFIFVGCEGTETDIDDLPILKDDILGDEDPNNPPPTDLSPLEAFEQVTENFDLVFHSSNAFTALFELNTEFYSGSTGYPLLSTQSKVDIDFDREGTYYFEQIMNLTEDRINGNTEQSFDTKLIDARSGLVKNYSIEGLRVSVDGSYPEQTFSAYLEADETIPETLFDYDTIESVERTDTNMYTTTVLASEFEDGALIDVLEAFNYEPTGKERIDIHYEFHPYNMVFTVELDAEFLIDDVPIKVKVNYTGSVMTKEYIQETISVYEHPYIMHLPHTKEEINLISSNDQEPMSYIEANETGWVKHHVEPGFYMFYVSGYDTARAYTVYDEDGNRVELDDRIEITEPSTFYIKIEASESIDIRTVFEKIAITDLVYEDHHDLTGGTITGINESEHDRNTYTLKGKSELGGVIYFDSSNGNTKQELTIISEHDMCHLAYDDLCVLYLGPNEDFTFFIISEVESSYAFDYYFIEDIDYSTDINLMPHLDDIVDPIHVGKDHIAYIKFDVSLYDHYYFKVFDIMERYNTAEYEIYTDEGILVEPSWSDKYPLSRGTYYIKLWTHKSLGIYEIELMK